MQVKEYDIDSLVGEIDFKSFQMQRVGDLMLTNKEVSVLDSYDINYKNCKSLKEIVFLVEEIINSMDIVDEELEMVSQSIAERDYYQNTNK